LTISSATIESIDIVSKTGQLSPVEEEDDATGTALLGGAWVLAELMRITWNTPSRVRWVLARCGDMADRWPTDLFLGRAGGGVEKGSKSKFPTGDAMNCRDLMVVRLWRNWMSFHVVSEAESAEKRTNLRKERVLRFPIDDMKDMSRQEQMGTLPSPSSAKL
jgi:hypothetical protein